MAPIKQHRDAAARNRDKAKKRRRPTEHANHLLYRCMGDLCGEECEQELQPVSNQRRGDNKRLELQQDMEMDEAASDPDDADYVDERERRRQPVMKAGRVGKVAAKKAPVKQIKDMPVKLGLQKAERYLCNALDFGVQAGYLTPKDTKGRVLRVASELLQTTVNAAKRINTDAMDARAIERRGLPTTTKARRSQRDSQDLLQEVCDEADVDDSKRQRRAPKRNRSGIRRQAKKRAMKSRSRSRSKRAQGGRKRSMGRSQSVNPDSESRTKPTKPESAEEQDDMGDNSQQTTTSSNNSTSRNEDDGKSVKSAKSSKSAPNNDSQTSNENNNNSGNKQQNDDEDDDDVSNDDVTDDDDDKNK